jgi:hypothetical protein
MLLRQTNFRTEMHMLHLLARPIFVGLQSDNYRAFRHFHPAVILNYNHDGLASNWCRPRHRVIVPHGSVEPWYGSSDIAEYLKLAGAYDMPVPHHELLLCTPETETEQLKRDVEAAFMQLPDFVAVIGYSFGHDDHVSWNCFCQTLNGFKGNIYVVDPKPEELTARIADRIKSTRVFGMPVFWDVLARAFVESRRESRKSLDHLYDYYGNRMKGGKG